MSRLALTHAARPVGDADRNSRAMTQARLRGLLDRHYDFVWRSLRRLGVPQADADDAAQQVFLVAARKLDRIAGAAEKGFLFGTAVRVASDVRRSHRRRREADDDALPDRPDATPGPDERLEELQARNCLDQILSGMPIELSSVFILFEIEELETTQIANMLNVPAGTIASRLRRARADFRQRAVRLRARMGLK